MTPEQLVQMAAADGVSLLVSPEGALKATGQPEAIQRWLPLVREQKSAVVAVLAGHLGTGNAELDRLIYAVAVHYQCSRDEQKLMANAARGDLDGALTSFRLMASEASLRMPSGRRH